MISRDAVQGFIDGYTAANAAAQAALSPVLAVPSTPLDPATPLAAPASVPADQMSSAISDWLLNHPQYPQTQDQLNVILSDLGTYKL